MTKQAHQYRGFHAEELIKGLQKLARNYNTGANIIKKMKDPRFNLFKTFKAQGTRLSKADIHNLDEKTIEFVFLSAVYI